MTKEKKLLTRAKTPCGLTRDFRRPTTKVGKILFHNLVEIN